MPYHYIEFDGVPLPIYNPSQDHSSTQVNSSLVRSAGGLFDYYGTRRRRGQGLQIQMTGLYIGGVPDYLVDHLGNNLVTHNGVFLVTSDGISDLRGQIDALRAKVGTQGRLVRHWLPEQINQQFILARLMRVGWPQEASDRTWKAEITCQFESEFTNWHSDAVSSVVGTVTPGVRELNIDRQGTAIVENATLTIVASSTITSIQLLNAALGVNMTWTGTLLAGETLVINNSTQTIRKDGVNAYNLVFAIFHSAQSWFPLRPGTNNYTITADGSGTATMSYREQWL